MKKLISLALVLILASSLFACAKKDDHTEDLETLTHGKLTIGTGEPAWEPWVINDAPESGEGFEAALAYAVAEQLGFAKEDVVWVRTQFEEAIAPGAKNFDFNLQQYSVTEERRAAVDFSTPYYKEPLAVIVRADGAFAGATSVADLKDALFGAASGDIAISYTTDVIKPTREVQVFNSLADVAQQLNNKQIDAFIAGVTTADYNVNFELDNGVIVGILDGSESVSDGLALVLDKDSPLTEAVSAAVDALLADGTVDELRAKWLGQYDLPVLK
ncbi:MAG: ABC transporter substrate-binding protein [Oscillospiraceae bacterium]|jgi:polar amino acid transport system substrate-binding protein|nr:ABC transporter substrate-binding protein [Oscillospiraceae bacterium]